MAALGLQRVSSFPRSSLRALANSLNFSFLFAARSSTPSAPQLSLALPSCLERKFRSFSPASTSVHPFGLRNPSFAPPYPARSLCPGQVLARHRLLPTHPPASSPMLNSSTPRGSWKDAPSRRQPFIPRLSLPLDGMSDLPSSGFPDPDPDREHDPVTTPHQNHFSRTPPHSPHRDTPRWVAFPDSSVF